MSKSQNRQIDLGKGHWHARKCARWISDVPAAKFHVKTGKNVFCIFSIKWIFFKILAWNFDQSSIKALGRHVESIEMLLCFSWGIWISLWERASLQFPSFFKQKNSVIKPLHVAIWIRKIYQSFNTILLTSAPIFIDFEKELTDFLLN